MLLNGFQKKSQKTPQEEIDKALKIKAEYFEEKNKQNKNEKGVQQHPVILTEHQRQLILPECNETRKALLFVLIDGLINTYR